MGFPLNGSERGRLVFVLRRSGVAWDAGAFDFCVGADDVTVREEKRDSCVGGGAAAFMYSRFYRMT